VATKPKTLILAISIFLVSSICFPTLSIADETPPSIPRPEGVGIIGMIDGNPIYGPTSGIVTWFPGMKDSSGTVIPPPLYNKDGTPYVEGVSPRPVIPSLSEDLKNQSVEWFPGMQDAQGTEIPTPIFNPDGSLYIEGVSPRPRVPVYIESNLTLQFSKPEKITDKALVSKINSEIKSMDVELSKSNNAYILNFEQNISAIDSDLYLSAINKKTKKTSKILIKIDSIGQAVAPTKMDLSKYNVYLKRGKTTLKKVTITN